MRYILALALVLTIAVSGCGTTSTGTLGPTQVSPSLAQTLSEAGFAANGTASMTPIPSSQEGSVPVPKNQTTPLPQGISSTGSAGDQPTEVSRPTPAASETAGQTDAGAAGMLSGTAQMPSASSANDQPQGWHVYANQQYGFSIAYPDSYVILDKDNPRDSAVEGRVYQVRFQDSKLAASETAELQLPQFRIELFEKLQAMTLEHWLDERGIGGARTALSISDRRGYKVSYQTQQAPNQFYYVASESYVYRLTPLDVYAQAMVGTFRIGQ